MAEASNILAEASNILAERSNILAEASNTLAERSNILAEASNILAEASSNLAERSYNMAEGSYNLAETSNTLTASLISIIEDDQQPASPPRENHGAINIKNASPKAANKLSAKCCKLASGFYKLFLNLIKLMANTFSLNFFQ